MAWWLSGAADNGPVDIPPLGSTHGFHWQTSIPGGFSTPRHSDSVAAWSLAKLSAGYTHSRQGERGLCVDEEKIKMQKSSGVVCLSWR